MDGLQQPPRGRFQAASAPLSRTASRGATIARMNAPLDTAIAVDVYRQRRERVLAALRAAGGGVAIVPTAPEVPRNRDTDYPYRFDSYFHYLTGFSEPDAVLVLNAAAPHGAPESILFCRAKNADREIWEGFLSRSRARCVRLRRGVRGRRDRYRDAAPARRRGHRALPVRRIGRLRAPARGLGRRGARAGAHGCRRAGRDARPHAAARRHAAREGRTRARDHDARRAHLRPRTAARCRRAAPASANTNSRPNCCMCSASTARSRPRTARSSRRRERVRAALPAGNAAAQDGDLILIDAACELDGYASDITRLVPGQRRFSPAQRTLYDIVLAAQPRSTRRAPACRSRRRTTPPCARGAARHRHHPEIALLERRRRDRRARLRRFYCIAPATGSAWTCIAATTASGSPSVTATARCRGAR